MKHKILSHEQIAHKIKRIAYQIYEVNVDQKRIVLAGIRDNGYVFSKKIKAVLETISDLEVTLCSVLFNSKSPLEIETSLNQKDYQSSSLILVDDVLSSGKTLMYCSRHFLSVPLEQFKTAVLVNRNHKKYPIKADFKGISLSTSLNENVTVSFGVKNVAYLD